MDTPIRSGLDVRRVISVDAASARRKCAMCSNDIPPRAECVLVETDLYYGGSKMRSLCMICAQVMLDKVIDSAKAEIKKCREMAGLIDKHYRSREDKVKEIADKVVKDHRNKKEENAAPIG